MSPLPPPATLSTEAVQTSLKLYPLLVEKVYGGKLKNDSKKVADALERDRWRFEKLPAVIAAMKSGEWTEAKQSSSHADVRDGALTKDALERLVQWKITNGHSRPFLPAMVRKNDAAAVHKQIKLAWERLSASSAATPPSTSTVTAALNLVCELKGIGPATGTLILNVYDPVHVPFFQDEMFMWFFPDTKSDKLKYNQKEYLQLLEASKHVLEELHISAVELEKIAYVLEHMELLEPPEREELEVAVKNTGRETQKEEPESEQAAAVEDQENRTVKQEKQFGTTKGVKRASSKLDDDDSTEPLRPKRRSQRTK